MGKLWKFMEIRGKLWKSTFPYFVFVNFYVDMTLFYMYVCIYIDYIICIYMRIHVHCQTLQYN